MSQEYGQWSEGPYWPGRSSGLIRAHAVQYKTDEKGRTRWYAQSRLGEDDGLGYQEIEILTPAGFMTSPKVGENNELLLFEVDGDRGHLVAFVVGDSEKRQKLPEGWVGMANPDLPDHHVQVDDEGNIHVHAPGKVVNITEAKTVNIKVDSDVTIDAPTINTKGLLNHEGDIVTTGSITSGGPHIASAHI